jgi:hypothetical protein
MLQWKKLNPSLKIKSEASPIYAMCNFLYSAILPTQGPIGELRKSCTSGQFLILNFLAELFTVMGIFNG